MLSTGKFCILYLNYILLYNKSFEEHVKGLSLVLRALQHYSVKLRPTKYGLWRRCAMWGACLS